jgi:hypothetical protein
MPVAIALRKMWLAVFGSLALSALACSATGPLLPSSPDLQPQATVSDPVGSSHSIWGFWEVAIDPGSGSISVTETRTAAFNANIVRFLQPPYSPTNLLTVKANPGTDMTTGYLDLDISIKHPFPGLKKFRGFDVKGIVMSDAIPPMMVELQNLDGWTRWWNPSEFTTYGTILGYTQGNKATPGYLATAIVNPYKYYADSLDKDAAISTVDISQRGSFSTNPGINTRRFILQFPLAPGPIYKFNYAVDACWAKPSDDFGTDYPIEAFPPEANQQEAWRIDVTDTGSTAWYKDNSYGGSVKLDIEVFDWQAPFNPLGVPGELAGLWLEGDIVSYPIDLLPLASVAPGGPVSSVFQVEITDLALSHSGPTPIWIIAQNLDPNNYAPQIQGDPYQFAWPDKPLNAFCQTIVEISDVQPQNAPVVLDIQPDQGAPGDIMPALVTGQYFLDGCQVELRESGGPFIIEGSGETWMNPTSVNVTLDLTGAPVDTYDVVVINPDMMEGSLDDGFTILGNSNVIYVDDSNTSGIEDGTIANPFNTIQEGLAAASDGVGVWVDDSDGEYIGPISLVSGVVLKSVNWDSSDGDDEATIRIDTPETCVNGADNATIGGFVIDAVRCGIGCAGTSPEILNCRIVNCYNSDARPIWLSAGSHAHVDWCEVYDVNNATDYGYATFYGILVEDCDSVGADRVLIEHTAVHHVFSSDIIDHGGGYCYPHGILISSSDGAIVRNCIVYDITGGNYQQVYGIRVADSSDVELVNNVIFDVEKIFYYGEAYGLFFTGCTNLDVRNTIINRVVKGEDGTGYYQSAYGVYGDASTYAFEYNDVYYCTNGLYVGVAPGVGCISSAPEFIDITPGLENFHLDSGSPCIDSGDPSIFDFDATQSDMGSYGGPGGNW